MALGASAVAAVPAAAAGGPTTYISDTFTRANGDLHGSTPETTVAAATWLVHGGAGKVSVVSNKAKCTASTANLVTVVDSGHADGTVSCDVTYSSSGNIGVTVRSVSAGASDDRVDVFLLSTGKMALYTAVAGSYSQIGSDTAVLFTNGVTYAIKIVMLGTTISVYVDNVIKINGATVAANSTRTSHGFRIDSETVSIVDNFLVTS